jgi:hypothetical protein
MKQIAVFTHIPTGQRAAEGGDVEELSTERGGLHPHRDDGECVVGVPAGLGRASASLTPGEPAAAGGEHLAPGRTLHETP